MRVCGIDPSLTATGVAEWDGTAASVTYKRHVEGDERLKVLFDTVCDLAGWHDLAIVENAVTSRVGGPTALLAHGAIRTALVVSRLPYLLVAPTTLKKFATGRGTATKADMRMEWFRRTGNDLRDDNAVDASWLRALGSHMVGAPLFPLPKTHTDALSKLTLPEHEDSDNETP